MSNWIRAEHVLRGELKYSVECGDCLPWLRSLPSDSVDMVFGSPPYEDARTYGMDFAMEGQGWVNWMVEVFHQLRRVCTGLVAMIVEGRTRKFSYSATPALLMSDLHRAGFVLRKPPIYLRVGIPGSGGPDWLRNDWEWIVCTTRGGKLPWSDNTACGHPPKYGPGGEPSHRTLDGTRVSEKRKTGSATRGKKNGDLLTCGKYSAPALANPGNVIHCRVGGGHMGSALSAENEAPFPESLADFFVQSFCRPGGVVLDPFSGSGTTGASAIKNGRRFIGCDVRASQVDLSLRRLATASPMLFTATGDPIAGEGS